MKMIFVTGGTALLIATLAGCGSSAPSPKPTGPAATAPASGGSPTATTAPATGSTSVATTDPCQLVTAQEASALTGASYGQGSERTSAIAKTCVYGSATKNVFMVDVFQGSPSQLKQVRDHVSAELQQAGGTAQVNSTTISGLGDGATAYQISSEVFNGSSIFALKGSSAIYLVDEVTGGSSAPTTAALTAAARTALGRLP